MSRDSIPIEPDPLDPSPQLTGAERELAEALGALAPSAPRLGMHDIAVAHARMVATRRVRRWQAASGVLGVALLAAVAWRGGAIPSGSVAPPDAPSRMAAADANAEAPGGLGSSVPDLAVARLQGTRWPAGEPVRDASYVSLRRAVLERGVSWLAMHDRGADIDGGLDPEVPSWGLRSPGTSMLEQGGL